MKTSKKYQICNKTVMDTSDPSITFDAAGISNHFWDFQKNVMPYWRPGAMGEGKLEKIVSKIKAEGIKSEYDCLIGLSGGADSSYMLHVMVTKYGLRPLVFHVDGGWNSEAAVNNINVMIDKLGLDLFTEVINWREMQDFQLAMFKSGVPHIDLPQDLAFIGVLYKFAEKYDIKYILNGGNISTESVLVPLDILYWGTDMVHVRDLLSKHGSIKMGSYPFVSVFYHKFYLRYFKKVRVVKPLNFMPYIKDEAAEELSQIYGWKPFSRKHFESRFTEFFESYWLPSRFGYDMRRNQLSSLILSGQTTRELALEELKKPPYDPGSIDQDFRYIANKLNIGTDELELLHQAPKKFYWDYRNQSHLFKIGEKMLKMLQGTRRGGAF